jgi:hypothetical protein
MEKEIQIKTLSEMSYFNTKEERRKNGERKEGRKEGGGGRR